MKVSGKRAYVAKSSDGPDAGSNDAAVGRLLRAAQQGLGHTHPGLRTRPRTGVGLNALPLPLAHVPRARLQIQSCTSR